MSQKREFLTVSLPPDMARKFDKLARGEGKNKSQFFREMFHTYEQQRRERKFYELQRYGASKARKMGILTEADVEALLFQDR